MPSGQSARPTWRAPPGRRWGFHRLSSRTAARLVADAPIQPGDLVLDVGAGDGVLTRALVAAGARVVAVELHPERFRQLRREFRDAPVQVVRADAASLRLPGRPFRVVANPPFGITTALLRRLLAPGSRLVTADLVVPRPTMWRWMAAGAPGAGRWRQDYEIAAGRRVPRRTFRPPAPADCVVLTIRRRGGSR